MSTTMVTHRGVAIALRCAVERGHLGAADVERLAEALLDAAADLEMDADEAPDPQQRKILARRSEVLGGIADAIDEELEKAGARS